MHCNDKNKQDRMIYLALNETSGNLIRRHRKKLGLTLEEVANELKVSKSTVSKWERGFIVNLKRDKLIALSHLLNISPLEIIDGEIIDGHQLTSNEFINQLNDLLFITTDLTEQEKNMILEYVKLICKTKGE